MNAPRLLPRLALSLLPLLLAASACDGCSEAPTGRVDMDHNAGPDGGDSDLSPPTENCVDVDKDGALAGPSCQALTDCNDTDASINPSASEVCGDSLDNNCDGLIDEGCPCTPGTLKQCSSAPVGVERLGPSSLCKPGVQICLDGEWSLDCQGELGPQPELCNQLDDDCDGQIDEQLRNAFGLCLDDLPPDYMPPEESCGPSLEGDGLDNNGDGQVDEGCSCALPEGAPGSAGPRTGQPCYSGSPATLGVGVCAGGKRDCAGDQWGECVGSTLPSEEICGDGLDNDCNGQVDDNCLSCVPSGEELCDGLDNDCDGVIDEGVRNACGGCGEVAAAESCGDGLDNNCDGQVDEGCGCPVTEQACYVGPPESAGVGICQRGQQACAGEEFGACSGSIRPQLESCGADNLGDGLDNDCDGQVDEGCGACQPGQQRLCGKAAGVCEYGTQSCESGAWGPCQGGTGPESASETLCDGLDNDCDGLTDEGLLNACGRCNEACYTEDFDPTSDGNTDEGVEVIPGDSPENPRPGEAGITLGKKNTYPAFLWAANNAENQVSKVDTTLNEEVARYWVGINPSRTAVDLDGNMWVIGRDDGRVTKIMWNENDCTDRNQNGVIDTSRRVNGTVTVLNNAGNPLADECVAYSEILNPNFPSGRGIAVTGDGLVWFSFSAPGLSGGVQALDARTFVKTVNYPNVNIPYFSRDAATGINAPTSEVRSFEQIYGIIADGQGNLWANTWAGTTGVAKFDTATLAWTEYYDLPSCGTYGIAVDASDRLWAGCWSANDATVGMLDPATRYSQSFALPASGYNSTAPPAAGTVLDALLSTELGQASTFLTSAVGVEPATGDVWITHNDSSGTVSRLSYNETNPTASTFTIVRAMIDDAGNNVPGVGAAKNAMRGIGFDSNGFAWYLGLSTSSAIKIDPATNKHILSVPIENTSGHYTYSDFTGSSVFSITSPRGLWRTVFDTKFANALVVSLYISAEVPMETELGVRLRAIDELGNPTSDWIPAPLTGPTYEIYPSGSMDHTFVLSTFGGPLVGTLFELEVQFSTSNRDLRPIIYDIQLGWSRP